MFNELSSHRIPCMVYLHPWKLRWNLRILSEYSLEKEKHLQTKPLDWDPMGWTSPWKTTFWEKMFYMFQAKKQIQATLSPRIMVHVVQNMTLLWEENSPSRGVVFKRHGRKSLSNSKPHDKKQKRLKTGELASEEMFFFLSFQFSNEERVLLVLTWNLRHILPDRQGPKQKVEEYYVQPRWVFMFLGKNHLEWALTIGVKI